MEVWFYREADMVDFRQFEAMTFDCYGTLIDWEHGIISVLAPLCERCGVVARDNDILTAYARAEAHLERGYYRAYREVLREALKQVALHFEIPATEIDPDALADSLIRWRPFPDTVNSLRALSVYFRLGIISNIDDDLFGRTADKLDTSFDCVTTAQTAGAYKPAYRIFRLASQQLGVHPSRIVHVAQSRFHDIRPASALGWTTVWVDRRRGIPGSGATPDSSARPDLTVFDLTSLCRIVRTQLGTPRRHMARAEWII